MGLRNVRKKKEMKDEALELWAPDAPWPNWMWQWEAASDSQSHISHGLTHDTKAGKLDSSSLRIAIR